MNALDILGYLGNWIDPPRSLYLHRKTKKNKIRQLGYYSHQEQDLNPRFLGSSGPRL